MKISFILAFLFLISYYSFGQQFNLNTCNSIKDTSSRTTCLKNSVDNLILKELERDVDMLRLQPGITEKLDLEILVSTVGNFSISAINTPNFAIARAVNVAISSIKPLAIYKDEDGNFMESVLIFSNSYTITPENQIEVKDLLHNDIDQNREAIGYRPAVNDDVAFAIIENVPEFPGCEGGDNIAKKKCLSDAIDQYVRENFNASLASTLNLASGRHRISVQFKINKSGYIAEVLARAPHPYLEQEVKRVIESLPKMKPGLHRGKEVNVMYSLPIIFQIEGNSPKEKRKKRTKS